MKNTQALSIKLGAIALLGGAVLLGGCGGSASGDSAAPAADANGEFAQPVKTRPLLAFELSVTAYKASSAADAAVTRFEVKVSDASTVGTLSAAVGTDYAAAASVTPTNPTPGVWSVAVPAGAAPDAGLLLTFNLKDGDSLETGLKDFPLK